MPQRRIPIIFNLISWRKNPKNHQDLFDWMTQILEKVHAFPKKEAQKLLEDGTLIPMFDGFDEIKEDYLSAPFYLDDLNLKAKCIEAIHGLQEQRKGKHKPITSFVIASRKAEYEASCRLASNPQQATRVRLWIKPLTIERIRERLDVIPEDNYSQQAAKKILLNEFKTQNTVFQDIICTPFYFNAFTRIITRKDQTPDFPKDETLKTYLVEQLTTALSLDEKRYLHWIARQLQNERIVRLELTSFGPYMIQYEYTWLYQLIYRSVVIFAFISIVTLVLHLVGSFVYRLIFGLNFGLMGGLAFGLFYELRPIVYFHEFHKPYERFSLRSVGILLFLTLATLITLFICKDFDFLYVIPFFTVTFICIAHESFISHFVLRCTLYLEKSMPLRWVTFFNKMAEVGIFEKESGGSWRFRHQILQDYFIGYKAHS